MICKHTIRQVIDHVNTGYVRKSDQAILVPLLEAQIPVEASLHRSNSCKCPSCLKVVQMPTSITRRQTGWFCHWCGQMLKFTQDS